MTHCFYSEAETCLPKAGTYGSHFSLSGPREHPTPFVFKDVHTEVPCLPL